MSDDLNKKKKQEIIKDYLDLSSKFENVKRENEELLEAISNLKDEIYKIKDENYKIRVENLSLKKAILDRRKIEWWKIILILLIIILTFGFFQLFSPEELGLIKENSFNYYYSQIIWASFFTVFVRSMVFLALIWAIIKIVIYSEE